MARTIESGLVMHSRLDHRHAITNTLKQPENLPALMTTLGQSTNVPLQVYTVATNIIDNLVQHKVKTEVEKQLEQAPPPAPQAASGNPAHSLNTTDINNDELVRDLMQRMDVLAQEDRFRSGKLR